MAGQAQRLVLRLTGWFTLRYDYYRGLGGISASMEFTFRNASALAFLESPTTGR
jgi:hypothetical protein